MLQERFDSSCKRRHENREVEVEVEEKNPLHFFFSLVLKLQRLPLRAPRGLRCPARPTLLVSLDGEEVPDLDEFGIWGFSVKEA